MVNLTEAEGKLMDIIWDDNPVHSKQLVDICLERFDWKKSTTYTILKKLVEKGMVENEHATVSSKMSRDEYQYAQKKHVIEKYFDSSLPSFLTAFAHEKKLSKKDIQELESIIEHYKGDKDE